jgi:pyruvate ferredoxin oxidoreductase alpha subunit
MSNFIVQGHHKCEFVNVEGEFSAMGVVKAASRAGARTFCCTAGPGQMYMHQPMHGAADMRLPIVMATVNRGKKEGTDHTDIMSQMWTGWIQLYVENNQEILDTVIMAYKVAEDKRVRNPVDIAYEGYVLSYTAEPVEIPDQIEVDEFLPPYEPTPNIMPENFNETVNRRLGRARHPQRAWKMHHEALLQAKEVITEVNEEYGEQFGRKYGNGLVEEYRCENAEALIVAMGTIASSGKVAIDRMRSRGKAIGLVRIKCFVPFPAEDVQRIAQNVTAMGVIDRNCLLGHGGAGYGELARNLYGLEERPKLLGFYAGLRGAEVTIADIEKMAEKTLKAARGESVEPLVEWSVLGGQ